MSFKSLPNAVPPLPFFSIVMPVYKTEQFLYQAIESVIEQTYINFELIVINNNSSNPDGITPLNVIKKFNDNRIIYKYCANQGVSYARNLGLDVSTGQYILLLDSDDYYSNISFLSDLMNEISSFSNNVDSAVQNHTDLNISTETRTSDIDIYYIDQLTPFITKDDSSIDILEDESKKGRSTNPNFIKELVHISIPEGSFVIDSKYIKEGHRFNNNMITAEGFSLLNSIQSRYNYKQIYKQYHRLNSKGIMYRQHPSSTTSNLNWQQTEKQALQSLYTDLIKDNNLPFHPKIIARLSRFRLNFDYNKNFYELICFKSIVWVQKILTNWKF